MDQRFKSKEELEAYLLQNKTPFSEFEKRIDYSLFEKSKKRIQLRKIWKKIGIVFASVLAVAGISTGIYFASTVNNKGSNVVKGTYTFSNQEGKLISTTFNKDSYVVISKSKEDNLGVIDLSSKDETIYAEFFNCEFSNKDLFSVEHDEYVITYTEGKTTYRIDFSTTKKQNCVYIKIIENSEYLEIKFNFQK